MKKQLMKNISLCACLLMLAHGIANAASYPPPVLGNIVLNIVNKSANAIQYSWNQEACGAHSGVINHLLHIDCSNIYSNVGFIIGSNSDPAGQCIGYVDSGNHIHFSQKADGSQGWLCEVDNGNNLILQSSAKLA